MLKDEPGEERIIEAISGIFAATSEGVPVAIGDDAALTRPAPGRDLVWTTDLLIEGVHFQMDWQQPVLLGRKSLAVNLSDLAAMGADATSALLSIAFPAATDIEIFYELCRGFTDLAKEHRVAVIGGDTCSNQHGLVISVAAAGDVPRGQAVLRSGAARGDKILVTGYLGNAAAGLRLLQGGISSRYQQVIRDLLDPVARMSAGKAARVGGASAMIDISDGLSVDLGRICRASGVGAVISSGAIPVSGVLRQAADELGWDPLELALGGGEDYELLITVAAAREPEVTRLIKETGTPVTAIGEIQPPEEGVVLIAADGSAVPMPLMGYDHFKQHEDFK